MYKIDYHIHAKFSFDSVSEYEDQFASAKAKGINVLSTNLSAYDAAVKVSGVI